MTNRRGIYLKIVHCQLNTHDNLSFPAPEVSECRCSLLLQWILKSLTVPGPLEFAWLIITSIDYIYGNKAGQCKWTAFRGANTSSDAACHEKKHFQHLFCTWCVLCLSDLSNLVFSMLGKSVFPQSTSQHVGFCGYKESLHREHLEMQFPSRSAGKHLSPVPQSYRGRKKWTDVELSWRQRSRCCSYQSEREECKKVRDLWQPRSHSPYAPANAHKNFAVFFLMDAVSMGTEVALVCTKTTPLAAHKKRWIFLSISIISLVFTNVSIHSHRFPPKPKWNGSILVLPVVLNS